MKFKKFVVFSLFFLLLALPVHAAEENVQVKVDGLLMHTFIIQPIASNGVHYMFLKDFSQIIDGRYVMDYETQSAMIFKGDTKLTVWWKAKKIEVNEKAVNEPIYFKGESPMLSIEFLSELFGIEYSTNNNIVLLETGAGKLSVLNADRRISSDAEVISYKTAYSRALQANSTLKDLDENLVYLERSVKDTKQAVYDSFTLFDYAYDTHISTLRSLNSMESNVKNIELNKQISTEITEAALRNHVAGIEISKMDILLLEESIALEEMDIKNLELKYELGFLSESDLKVAKNNLESSKSRLRQAKLDLDSRQQALNRFMDYTLSRELIIEFTPEFISLPKDVKRFASIQIANAPTIKLLEQAIGIAEHDLNTSEQISTNKEMDKIQTENAYNKATRDLLNGRLDLEKNIYAAYNQIDQLLTNQGALEVELEKAQDLYNKVLVNYDAGNVTQYDVRQARLGILSAEINIEKNKYNLSNLMFTFERPYLLS